MILDRDGFGFWSWVAKRAFKATFTRPNPEEAGRRIRETLPSDGVAVYIHIPFCKGMCLYCPYLKHLWRAGLAEKYVEALKSEIRMYGRLLEDLDVKIVDVHVGGGTPSLLDGRHYREIMDVLGESFDMGCEGIAIEANPNDVAEEDRAHDLVEAGVDEISLGVQSFNEKTLRRLGRRHGVDESFRAIEAVRDAGVEYLNVDMMYMVPGSPAQTLEEWVSDLEEASRQDVDEITCYPTLITPQCPGYRLVKEGRVSQPDKATFKKMIAATYEVLEPAGYESVEIYGFSRREGWKYATVNYEMEGPLLGFGCGAMGFTGGYEYANTHSVEEYVRAVEDGNLPIAGSREVDARERAIRYTASRLFVCRQLDTAAFKRTFGAEFEDLMGSTPFGRALKFLKLRGIIERRGEKITLTRKGLEAAHMQCWSFVLNVPCRIAEEYSKTPWPETVVVP